MNKIESTANYALKKYLKAQGRTVPKNYSGASSNHFMKLERGL